MESETDVWKMFSAAGDGCYLVNRRRQIVLWNDAARDLLGVSPEEALRRPCYEVIRGENEDGLPLCRPKCAIWEAFSQGTVIPSYYLLAHGKEEESLWLSVSPLRMPGPPARWEYLVHLVRDATREKRALSIADRVSSFLERHVNSIPTPRDAPSADLPSFSRREIEILRLLSAGQDMKTIAAHLSISHHTVRNHLRSISGKAGLHNRLELLIYAFKNQLI